MPVNTLHQQIKSQARVLLLVALTLLASAAYGQHVYYRYLNSDGVKVLDHSIPPEYAQGGYEVLNASGQVVKVVPPAPSEDELARNAEEREIQGKYARLKRRYSSVKEIDSAKHRRLKNIDTNISILKGNINGLNTQQEKILGSAAAFERRGHTVPDHILQQLKDTKAELKIAEELLEIRNAEYQEIVTKFDQDIAIFAKGEVLEHMSSAKIQ